MTTFYKTLVNGKSFHGGDFEWSLPKNGKPGKWHKFDGKIQMCRSGFHLTSVPANWWQRDAKCYEAQYRGDVLTEEHSDKICVREVRLVREVDPVDVQIFYQGEHRVTSGKALAYDSAVVEAYGSASVRATGSAVVEAYDSAVVMIPTNYATHVTATAKDAAIIIDRRTTPSTIYGKAKLAPQEAK